MLKKAYVERCMVTNGWISLDAADLGLIESVYKKTLREGEERLMLAVLESAVEDFQKYVPAPARSVESSDISQQGYLQDSPCLAARGRGDGLTLAAESPFRDQDENLVT
jgi:hypothetical protein